MTTTSNMTPPVYWFWEIEKGVLFIFCTAARTWYKLELVMIIPSIFPKDVFTAGFETRSESVRESRLAEPFRGRIFRVRQVHSARVVAVSDGDTPESLAAVEADALVTARRSVLLTVWVADCVPVLLAHRGVHCAAAVHAGWRGLAGGIIPAAVGEMLSLFGAEPGSMLAAVGPAIRRCCYEVGDDAAGAVARSCGDPGVIEEKDGKLFADLHEAARLQLVRAGLPPPGIEVVRLCTKCNDGLFYSHRRGNIEERQCGFIGMR
jgi:YfiH family protein